MNLTSTAAKYSRRPIEAGWPESDLETLGQCPICGSLDRSIAYGDLKDKIFFCAPGTWTLWSCASCDVVYLDPRPTLSSIGRAYAKYYTHNSNGKTYAKQIKNTLRKLVWNSYLSRQHGFRLNAALPLGWMLFAVRPALAANLRNRIRNLPPPSGEFDRVLDVGCGSGEFLEIARELGYQAEGIEVDPVAREHAAAKNLLVHPGPLPGSGLTAGTYSHILLNHVIEHFHDPAAALEEVYSLLRPGGTVWLQTPNNAAASLRRYGGNSRLLEPPRHLVIFNTRSLREVLAKVGFEEVTILDENVVMDQDYTFTVSQSWLIEQGLDPYATPVSFIPKEVMRPANDSGYDLEPRGTHAEMVAVTAKKP